MAELGRVFLQLLLSVLLVGALLPLTLAALPPEQVEHASGFAPWATVAGLVLVFLLMRLIWPKKRLPDAEKDARE